MKQGMKIALALTVMVMLVGTNVYAQKYRLSLSMDRQAILIGEQIEMTLEARFPVAEPIQFPVLTDTLTGVLEIVEQFKIDTAQDEDHPDYQILTQRFMVTSFDTGYHTVPPIVMMGVMDSAKTNPLLITVNGMDIDMPDQAQQQQPNQPPPIKDIKDIVSVSFSLIDWIYHNWLWLLIVYVSLAPILVYFVYFHNRQKETVEVIQEPTIPPHELALDKLHQLDEEKLWQAGKIKPYYSALSEIVREYMETRFRFNALESTTDEIMTQLRREPLEETLRTSLQRMLVLSDMVKFAKEKPLADEHVRSMEDAAGFVKQTKQEEVIPESNENEAVEPDV